MQSLSDCEIQADSVEFSAIFEGDESSYVFDKDFHTKVTIVPNESNNVWLKVHLPQVLKSF